MNPSGWQPVIGWTTVSVCAIAAAYNALSAADPECGKPRARLPRLAIVVCIAALTAYLLNNRGLSYVWSALGVLYTGDVVAECRRTPVNRAKLAANLLFVLAFFALGPADMMRITALSAAAFLLMVLGWVTLLVFPNRQT